MTDHERAILLSFLEARPAYLRAPTSTRSTASTAALPPTCARGLHLTGEGRREPPRPGGLERAPENACALEADSPKARARIFALPVQMPVRPRNGRLRLAITGSNLAFPYHFTPFNWHRAGP